MRAQIGSGLRLGFATKVASPDQVDRRTEFERQGAAPLAVSLTRYEAKRDWPALDASPFEFAYADSTIKTPAGYLNPSLPMLKRRTPRDVWVLRGFYTYPSLCLARRQAERDGVPWVFWGERPNREESPTCKLAYLRRFLRGAVAIWAISRRACRFHSELTDASVRPIPYALTPPFATQACAELRLPDPDDPSRLLLVGQLVQRKNPDLVLDVALRLAAIGTSAAIALVESGPLETALRARVRDQSITGIAFTGNIPRDALMTCISQADALLFPSPNDGWDLVAMESLGVGTPVIGSRHAHAVVEATAVDPRVARVVALDAEALATAVCELASSAGFRAANTRGSAQTVAARFGRDKVAQRIITSAAEAASRQWRKR